MKNSGKVVNNGGQVSCLVDAHVHLYSCFHLPEVLDAALRNMQSAATQYAAATNFTGCLLLSETADEQVHQQLQGYAVTGQAVATKNSDAWVFSCPADDNTAVIATNATGQSLVILAGRQIVTREGLEVLALISPGSFNDGLPLEEVISQIVQDDGIAVLPWAVGKWLGKRGRLLDNLMQAEPRQSFMLGDNGGRPVFWRNPHHLSMAMTLGIKILPGSDPLPLASEGNRVGSFGFVMQHELSLDRPGEGLKQLIRDRSVALQPYGALERASRFVYNQARLRMR